MAELLSKKKCKPCDVGMPPLQAKAVGEYIKEVPNWSVMTTVTETKRLHREFKFKDFRESIEFVRKVADIAESEGHHPDIFIFYNIVRLDLWTHNIGGLSENDFIIAAKIEELV